MNEIVFMPAHSYGILGLKPTDNLVPISGHIVSLPGNPRRTRHMLVAGPLARSMPLAQTADGLPIGMQVVGRRWHDMDLLSVAASLAAITGPFPKPPGY